MPRFWVRVLGVVPALLATALALLVRDRLWVSEVVGMRSGSMRTVPAHMLLMAMPLLTVLYAITYTWLVDSFLTPRARFGMRLPSEAEHGCAVLLLRAMIVAALYALAILAWYR